MPKIANKSQFLTAIKSFTNGNNIATRAQCVEAANSIGLKYPPAWFVQDKTRSAGRGQFYIDVTQRPKSTNVSTPVIQPISTPMSNTNNSLSLALAASTNGDRTSLVPDVNPNYVAWGHYDDILKIVQTRMFAPVLITGMSGNGKTEMVEQICAKMKRECFRVNITEDTDEDELMGSWRLVNGNMEWQDGPVVLALKRGAVLLLDEVDLATPKVMCLQSPLEGKGCYLKKINQKVLPADGFQIIATANTKGKGSDDGRFVGTRVLNEAMLDRFDYCFEQDYSPRSVEKKILLKAMKKFGSVDESFADNLVKWTEIIRKSFAEGAVDEIISTRRAINICKAYSVFGDKQKSIQLALARFDKDTQTAFLSLYTKIDADLNSTAAPAATAETPNTEVPF
jgi:MoxR-like ATPase